MYGTCKICGTKYGNNGITEFTGCIHMELLGIVFDLERQIKSMEDTFITTIWKFYKFGRGGPYFVKLQEFQDKANKFDAKLFDFFKLKKDTASFTNLIVLCLNSHPKEQEKNISTFKRQIKHMKETLNG
jgi:hypothetical protein